MAARDATAAGVGACLSFRGLITSWPLRLVALRVWLAPAYRSRLLKKARGKLGDGLGLASWGSGQLADLGLHLGDVCCPLGEQGIIWPRGESMVKGLTKSSQQDGESHRESPWEGLQKGMERGSVTKSQIATMVAGDEVNGRAVELQAFPQGGGLFFVIPVGDRSQVPEGRLALCSHAGDLATAQNGPPKQSSISAAATTAGTVRAETPLSPPAQSRDSTGYPCHVGPAPAPSVASGLLVPYRSEIWPFCAIWTPRQFWDKRS